MIDDGKDMQVDKYPHFIVNFIKCMFMIIPVNIIKDGREQLFS